MRASLAAAIPDLLVIEGSELNINPPGTPAGQGEPGGASRYGVSVTALSDLRKSQGKPPATVEDIRNLTADGAAEFYRLVTAASIRFEDLNAGVDYRLFDITANLGPTGGVWALELALGHWPLTGKMTDDLVATANAENPRSLVKALSAAWISKKHESPNWNPSPLTRNGYGHGWSNRNIKATARALALIGAST